MNFAFSPEQETFRGEVKEFLHTNLPAGWQPRGFIMISEDEWRDLEDEVQKLTDRFVKSIDDHLKHKETEIMKV